MEATTLTTDIDSDARRRELRRRIARHRRRINQHVARIHREGRRLVSWRTHVVRNPRLAIAGAFGVGLLAAVAFRPASARWFGRQLIAAAGAALRFGLRRELERLIVSRLQTPTAGEQSGEPVEA